MNISGFAATGWALGLFFSGLTIGIVGTCLYWTRWRKKALAYINQYKAKIERLENAWDQNALGRTVDAAMAKANVKAPGLITKE